MLFIEMFEDYWNYNYQMLSLNIREVVRREIAMVKGTEQQYIEGNSMLQLLWDPLNILFKISFLL